MWPASKGLPLPGTLTLLKPLPSIPLPASCHDQARPPPPLTWRAALSPVSTIHFPHDSQRAVSKMSLPGESRGCSSQGKVPVCHSLRYWVLLLPPCLSPPFPLSVQLFWLSGLHCSLCPETCIYPQLCPARAFLPDALSGGPGTHLGLPSHSPIARLSPIWQFLREGGNPGLT